MPQPRQIPPLPRPEFIGKRPGQFCYTPEMILKRLPFLRRTTFFRMGVKFCHAFSSISRQGQKGRVRSIFLATILFLPP